MLFIEKKSSNGSNTIDIKSVLQGERKLFLEGSIDESTVNDWIGAFLYYEQEPDLPLYIYINSGGGSCRSGLILIDLIRNTKIKDVYLIVTESACSMAALILSSGKPGYRFAMSQNSTIMVHQPLISGENGGLSGSCDDIKSFSEKMCATKDKLNKLLADNCHKSVKAVAKATSYDHYMTSEEALEFGIIDGIATSLMPTVSDIKKEVKKI